MALTWLRAVESAGGASGPEVHEAAFADLPVPQSQVVRRAWDDATAMLTDAGLPATFDTVCALVAAGKGFSARYARGLIERAVREEVR